MGASLALFIFFFIGHLTLCFSFCQQLNSSSLCNFLNYQIVSINNTTCQDTPEKLTRDSSFIWYLVSPPCRVALSTFFCTQNFPSCDTNNLPIPPCQSICLTLDSSCDSYDKTILQNLNQTSPYNKYDWTCTNFPTSNCYTSTLTLTDIPTPKCANYTTGFCAGVVDYEYYQQVGFNLSLVEATISAASQVLPLANDACRPNLFRFICGQAYPRCNRETLPPSVLYQPPFPSYPCHNICQNYSQTCTVIIPASPALTPGCGSIGKLDFYQGNTSICGNLSLGLPDWPTTQTTYGSFNGSPISTTCNAVQAVTTVNVTCPYPLIETPAFYIGFFRKRYPGSPCETVCPFYPLFLETEWNSALQIMYLSFPSFFLALFLVLTWTIFPSKRKQIYILNFNIAALALAATNMFSFAAVKDPHQLRRIGCAVDAGYRTITHDGGYCVFQGFGNFVFMLATVCWWLIIALDIWLKAVATLKFTRPQEVWKNRAYFGFGWGFPLLSVSVFMMSKGGLGGTPCMLFCWSNTSWDTSQSALEFIFFFTPIGIFLTIGACLIGSVLYTFQKSSRAVHETNSTGSAKITQDYSKTLRPILFVVIFFVIYILLFIFRIDLEVRSHHLQDEVTIWLRCIFENPDDSSSVCPQPQDLLPRSLWYATHFAIAGQGTLQFLIWGLMVSNYDLWKILILEKKLDDGSSLRQRNSTSSLPGHVRASSNIRPASPSGKKLTKFPESQTELQSLGPDGHGNDPNSSTIFFPHADTTLPTSETILTPGPTLDSSDHSSAPSSPVTMARSQSDA